MTGDGKADIIAGMGKGGSQVAIFSGATGGPHVRALKGTGLGALRDFMAFDPGFLGGVFVG